MVILSICRPSTYEHSAKTITPKYKVTAVKSTFDSLLCLICYMIGHSKGIEESPPTGDQALSPDAQLQPQHTGDI